jgi:hypothetical protein
LVVMWEAAVSFCPMASQRELSSTLPLHSCYLHNLKFWLADCSDCHLLSHWYLIWLIFQPWRWRLYVPLKLQLTFSGQHGVMSQEIVLFITTAVRASKSYIFIFICALLFYCTGLIFTNMTSPNS